MNVSKNIFSVDAETNGLYGAVWAIGATVLNEDGVEVANFKGMIDTSCVTDPWVRKHIVPLVKLPMHGARPFLLNAFWAFWMEHKEDSICVADFGAPVEAGLFRACIELDEVNRMWDGPFPLHDLGTALMLSDVDVDVNRRELIGRADLVQHDPYDDAVTAALCWRKVNAPMNDKAVIGVTVAALKAGIVIRDLLGAAPANFLSTMPEDIAMRLMSPEYQDSVNRMPSEVRSEAERRLARDPWIQMARSADQAGRNNP